MQSEEFAKQLWEGPNCRMIRKEYVVAIEKWLNVTLPKVPEQRYREPMRDILKEIERAVVGGGAC